MRNILLSTLLVLSCSWAAATGTVKLRLIHADPQTANLSYTIAGTTSAATLRPQQTETIDIPAERVSFQLTNAQTSEALSNQSVDVQPATATR